MVTKALSLRRVVQEWVLEALNPRSFYCALEIPPPFLKEAETWESAYAYAQRLHCALPFLLVIQRALWAKQLPSTVSQIFAERQARERMALALLDWEMEEALQTLANASLGVIVLKGMDVGRRLYPERIFRPMADVDLLVKPRDFSKAMGRLEQRGFKSIGVNYPGRFRVEMSRGEGRPVIELHSFLLKGDSAGTMKDFWKRSLQGFEGWPGEARVLSYEDQLLYLGGHAVVQHLLESPLWLNDIHFLIEKIANEPHFGWPRVLKEINARCSNAAFWFLFSVLQKWGTPVPRFVIDSLTERVAFHRRTALTAMMPPERLFPFGGKGWSLMLSARFFLKDSALQAIQYAVARQRVQSFYSRFVANEPI